MIAPSRHRGLPAFASLALFALAGVATAATPVKLAPAAKPITVFAGASLTDVFPALDPTETYSFAGSNTLATQIANGAPADVFASANSTIPASLYAQGLVEKPVDFTRNTLVIVVPIDEQPDRDSLHQRLELAAAARRNDTSAQHRESQHRDTDLAGQDHHRDPPRQVAQHRQTDQRGADQQLVGDRIGELAEFGHHSVAAGQLAVQPIGDHRDREDREGGNAVGVLVAVAGEQHQQEDRHKHQPQPGEQVGDVGDRGLRGRRRSFWVARHRHRIRVTVRGLGSRYSSPVSEPPVMHPKMRRARTSDVPAIKRLVDTYAGKILLEKNLVTLYEAVQEFWVAELDDEVIGCGALHVLWSDLGEVRTVAVDPKVKGRGVGHTIVQRLLEVARELQLQRLFVLTFETDFFARPRIHRNRRHAGDRRGLRGDVPLV